MSARTDPADAILAVTPTLCRILGISTPATCTASPVDAVCDLARDRLAGGTVRKCLIFAPDALGDHLADRFPLFYDPVRAVARTAVPLRSVMPPKTPVCFASMFTGALPQVHGIRQYEKPVLACDTLFDAMIRAGLRVAVVAVRESSIDLIFRNRAMAYFSEPYDPGVTAQTLALIRENRYDVILAYHQAYDDAVHNTRPFDPGAVRAAATHLEAFAAFSRAVDRYWAGYHRMICFTPDHGAHTDPATGKGDHGQDIPEDMNLTHYYDIRPAGG